MPNYQTIRGSMRRIARTAIFRAIDTGILASLAKTLSTFAPRRGLYLRGRIMSVANRRADLTDFWKTAHRKFPAEADFLRQNVHFALRAGRQADAEAAMAALLRSAKAQAADSNLVLGLVYIYQQRGDDAAVRKLVREFLKSLKGNRERRIAGLRLSRIVLTHFARFRNQSMQEERERSHRQLTRMIERSTLLPEPKMLLERAVRAEKALTDKSALVLLDTDVSRSQCVTLVRLVHHKLATNRPFSLVRIGDGEAACLPYEPRLAWLAKGDAIERERIWWGTPLTKVQRRRMTRLVFNATWGADCIGIPTVSRFLREIRLAENDGLDRGLTGRGLRAILYSVERHEVFRGQGRPAAVFTSCHLHQDLERWGLYPELFHGAREVTLISCHRDLADFVRDTFRTKVAADIVLPPDRVSAPALKASLADGRRLPDILDEIAEKVGEESRGRLVLAGAGYLGKWLVDVARSRGGVALDVGSVFDYWLGLATRSYLDLNPVQ